MRRSLRPRFAAALLVLACGLALTCPALAQVLDPNLWITDGTVRATALSGNRLYVGGDFNYLGPRTGGSAELLMNNGARHPRWPVVRGRVLGVAADGEGGWYLVGDFTHVAGIARGNGAHVLADGSLGPWDPRADAPIECIAIAANTVYVGGSFTNIGGTTFPALVGLDRTLGDFYSYAPIANGTVRALAAVGNTMYVGGDFTVIGVASRNHLASFDISTGLESSWNPNVNGSVHALAVSGPRLYVGGLFTTVSATPRQNLACLVPSTATLVGWNPGTSGAVYALLPSAQGVYVGGAFATAGGASRSRAALLDSLTAVVKSWNPAPNGTVRCLAQSGDMVYMGGSFTTVLGEARLRLAAVSSTGILATGFAPHANGEVRALATAPGVVCAGGDVSSFGGVRRTNAAALDLASGRPFAWDPAPDGSVRAIALAGARVYLGGSFANVGGLARRNLAKLDSTLGVASSWNPNPDSAVRCLAANGAGLYVGGHFRNLGGAARNLIGEVDTTTAAATSWAPFASQRVNSADGFGYVATLVRNGGLVYFGGQFNRVNSTTTTRQNIAAVSAATGAVTTWNPIAAGPVFTLTPRPGVIYVGGDFTGIADRVTQPAIGAIDSATAINVASFVCALDSAVTGIVVRGDTLTLAGGFSLIDNVPRIGLGRAHQRFGTTMAWNPSLDLRATHTLLGTAGGDLIVGGGFNRSGSQPVRGLARFLPGPSVRQLQLTAPNGGEQIARLLPYRITWSTAGSAPGIESVDLYWSKFGAAGPWNLIASGVPNTGSFEWPLTDPAIVNATGYWMKLEGRDHEGTIVADVSDASFTLSNAAADVTPATARYALSPLAPNPVSGAARIAFRLPARERVRLTLLDVQGRELRRLADGEHAPGEHVVRLDTRGLAPGLCFVRFEAGGVELRQRFVVLH